MVQPDRPVEVPDRRNEPGSAKPEGCLVTAACLDYLERAGAPADVAARRVAQFKERLRQTAGQDGLEPYLALVEELAEEGGLDMSEIAPAAARLAAGDAPCTPSSSPRRCLHVQVSALGGHGEAPIVGDQGRQVLAKGERGGEVDRVEGSHGRRVDRGRGGQGAPVDLHQGDPSEDLAGPAARGRPHSRPP